MGGTIFKHFPPLRLYSRHQVLLHTRQLIQQSVLSTLFFFCEGNMIIRKGWRGSRNFFQSLLAVVLVLLTLYSIKTLLLANNKILDISNGLKRQQHKTNQGYFMLESNNRLSRINEDTRMNQEDSKYRPNYTSTCSDKADKRGSHQKVIAYSIYGDFSLNAMMTKYLKPLEENIKKVKQNFPGWVVRIYHNLKNGSNSVQNVLGNSYLTASHVDLCNVTKVMENLKLKKLFPMTWRWLPLLDEKVDVLLSRDSDSYILSREEEAIRDWLNSDGVFHVIRDHPNHCIPIVGGLWGAKTSKDRMNVGRLAEIIFSMVHVHKYNFDQIILEDFVWPIARKNLVAHDSYCCEFFSPSRPFPSKRKGSSFVGMKGLPIKSTDNKLPPCPRECRPKNVHQDEWRYC